MKSRYLIVPHKKKWLIKFDGQEFGPYKSKAEALLFAIDAAEKLGHQGKSTKVCVVGKNGRSYPGWKFGQYPYPDPQTIAA
jgi:hypothetical protein